MLGKEEKEEGVCVSIPPQSSYLWSDRLLNKALNSGVAATLGHYLILKQKTKKQTTTLFNHLYNYVCFRQMV